jgi:hypothetical protein
MPSHTILHRSAVGRHNNGRTKPVRQRRPFRSLGDISPKTRTYDRSFLRLPHANWQGNISGRCGLLSPSPHINGPYERMHMSIKHCIYECYTVRIRVLRCMYTIITLNMYEYVHLSIGVITLSVYEYYAVYAVYAVYDYVHVSMRICIREYSSCKTNLPAPHFHGLTHGFTISQPYSRNVF